MVKTGRKKARRGCNCWRERDVQNPMKAWTGRLYLGKSPWERMSDEEYQKAVNLFKQKKSSKNFEEGDNKIKFANSKNFHDRYGEYISY